MLKKLLGIAPKLEADGSYSPSKFALRMATVDITDYEHISYNKYSGKKTKILVICTEQKNMEMQNGKLFSTGNHPVESLLPMLHLKNAGFDFEIATPTGKPAVFEMWAMPQKDKHVMGIYNEYKSSFDNPKSLQELKDSLFVNSTSYAAVYIPGGHGAMLGIPEDHNVGEILHWAHENGLFTISICHGPAAFLATTLNDKTFIYNGYKMAVFPNSVDKQTPLMGYMPGHMPWPLSTTLEELGSTVINTKSDDTTLVDRRLITGASPLAANELGKLAANTLLKALN
ncbi:MAG: glyoxalase III HchA [Chloroflexota bacterium]